MTRLKSIGLCFALIACSEDPGVTQTAPGEVGKVSAALFDAQQVLNVEIVLPAEDWDALRKQTRGKFDVVMDSCLTQPPPERFSYFSGSVVIDGKRLENVGIRKKGFFGSLSKTKPALKLKFDEFVEDQEYSGLTRLTLNNAVSDPSYVNQCLGYQLFAKAGLPAPRCNFAKVQVNGQDLGLYVNVESVDKRFLARSFADSRGDLYEGSLSDFRPGWVNTFEKKTNEKDPDRSALDDLATALASSEPDAMERVASRVDLPEFIRFWAMEFLLMHADGYSRNLNNFIVYQQPKSGQFSFIPWGIDDILRSDSTFDWEKQLPEGAAWVEGLLARRLYESPEHRAKQEAALRELLDSVWNETAITAEIDRMSQLILPHLSPSEVQSVTLAQAELRSFVQHRRTNVEAALQVPVNTSQPLREPWCLKPMGTLSTTFESTWDSLGAINPLSVGAGSMRLTSAGLSPAFVSFGADSGIAEGTGTPVLTVYAAVSATDLWAVRIDVGDIGDLRAHATIPLDSIAATALVLHADLSHQPPTLEVVGALGKGSLELEAVSLVKGAPVTGRITDATLFKMPF